MTLLLLVDAKVPVHDSSALSILEKLQVPEGWCSSGLRAKLYTQILSLNVPAVLAKETPEAG